MEYSVLFGLRLRSIQESQGTQQRELATDRHECKYISQLETGRASLFRHSSLVYQRARRSNVSFFRFIANEPDPKCLGEGLTRH